MTATIRELFSILLDVRNAGISYTTICLCGLLQDSCKPFRRLLQLIVLNDRTPRTLCAFCYNALDHGSKGLDEIHHELEQKEKR